MHLSKQSIVLVVQIRAYEVQNVRMWLIIVVDRVRGDLAMPFYELFPWTHCNAAFPVFPVKQHKINQQNCQSHWNITHLNSNYMSVSNK